MCLRSIAGGPSITRAELERRRLRLPFECISRAERIDDAVADALASLGCFRVWIGSESGSQRVLDAMKRKVSVDQVHTAADRLRRRGIEVGMFIMLGYDGEQMSDLRATVDHLKRTAPDVFLTTVSYPIKGTPYYDTVSDRLASPQGVARGHGSGSGRPRPAGAPVLRLRPPLDDRRSGARSTLAARPLRARGAKSASSALVGRLGMAVTEHWRER